MNVRTTLATIAVTAFACLTGCQSAKGTETLTGSGIGAMIGAAVADPQSAVVGPAIGAGVGYVIGDELDQNRAREMSSHGETHDEVGPLGATKWQVRSFTTVRPMEPYVAKFVEFRPDGHAITTTTTQDGKIELFDESYRVVGDLLILNKLGYLINTKYRIDGQQMILTDPGFSAVLWRL